MNAVFVGGSRSISKLNKKLTRILDTLTDKGLTFLVGDANGADKAIQSYLLYRGYKKDIKMFWSIAWGAIAGTTLANGIQ